MLITEWGFRRAQRRELEQRDRLGLWQGKEAYSSVGLNGEKEGREGGRKEGRKEGGK